MRICVPLGALFEDSVEALGRAGLDVAPLRDAGRRLVVEAADGTTYITTRPSDVPVGRAMNALLTIEGLSRHFGGLGRGQFGRHGDRPRLGSRRDRPTVPGRQPPQPGIRSLPSTAGRIRFSDSDITRWPTEKRARAGIRRTFQTLKLFREMTVSRTSWSACTVRPIASCGMPCCGRPTQTSRRAIDRPEAREALDFVGLLHTADLVAGTLPHGVQRMVEIARAIVAKPRTSCCWTNLLPASTGSRAAGSSS